MDVVALTGSTHQEQGSVSSSRSRAPRTSPFRRDLTSRRRTAPSDTDGHRRVGAQLRLVVGVQAHAVLAGSVAVHEDVVRTPTPASASHPARSRAAAAVNGARLERLPRVAVAEVPRPGDQARLEDRPPEEHDLPLLPRQLVAELSQRAVRLVRGEPRTSVEPGASARGKPATGWTRGSATGPRRPVDGVGGDRIVGARGGSSADRHVQDGTRSRRRRRAG